MYEVLKERKSLIALSGMTGMSNKRKVHKSSMHCTVTGKRRRRKERERARPFLHQCITQKGLHRDSNTMILEGALTHTYGLTKHGSTSVEGNNIFYKHFSIYQQIAMVLL